MKRGRKQDNTLPPSRSREIQRAFRQRRSDYIRGLELRVVQLEAEVDEILARHNETLRYTTAEVVAARSASRKKQKNKSKHNLSQFMDVNPPHSPEFMEAAPDNSLGVDSSASNHDIRTELSCGARYLIHDMNAGFSGGQGDGGFSSGHGNGGFSSGQSSPQYSQASYRHQGRPGSEQEYDSHGGNSASILSRRSKPLLQLWNAPTKPNESRLSSQSSNPTPSSQVSLPISCNQYHNSNSQMEMFMDMNPVVPSPDMSSQLMSSLVYRPEMRIAPPSSCPLPSLLADSSPQNDPIPSVAFSSYNSNPDVDSPSYTYRASHSQLSDRLNSCSYTFIDSPNNPNPHASAYQQESHISLLRSRSATSDQTNLHSGSLSTLIAIAATRLGRFEPQQSDCSYQASPLHTSPGIIEPAIRTESSGNTEALQTINQKVIQDENAKSTRTATPCSTSPSESRELDPHTQCDPQSRSSESISFNEFDGNHNSACVPFYHPSATKNWREEDMSQFATEMYQTVNTSEITR